MEINSEINVENYKYNLFKNFNWYLRGSLVVYL